jgi:hypothetical protein
MSKIVNAAEALLNENDFNWLHNNVNNEGMK